MKKLHDLLVLRITQPNEEKKAFPLAQIIGRAGVGWEPEFPVDKGWIDIYVPTQRNVEQPYVIEVETGYDFNCSGILQKFERFRKALTERAVHVRIGFAETTLLQPVYIPKLCIVIPPDFAEFIPLFKAKEISVFLWEGTVEWECKKCEEIVLGSGPWKPKMCSSSSCKGKERNFRLVGLADFRIKEADV